MKTQTVLAEVAIHVLEGVYCNEDEAGGALGLSRSEITEVRRLMHLPFGELKKLAIVTPAGLTMDHASNFALEVQEMYANGTANPVNFKAALEKYGGTKRPDGITLDFSDGSVARWSETSQAWELNPRN